jgi:hypothetical protein
MADLAFNTNKSFRCNRHITYSLVPKQVVMANIGGKKKEHEIDKEV